MLFFSASGVSSGETLNAQHIRIREPTQQTAAGRHDRGARAEGKRFDIPNNGSKVSVWLFLFIFLLNNGNIHQLTESVASTFRGVPKKRSYSIICRRIRREKTSGCRCSVAGVASSTNSQWPLKMIDGINLRCTLITGFLCLFSRVLCW